MIKKYFALSLITASLLAAGCSSDDDDDDGDGGATTGTTDGATTGTTDGATTGTTDGGTTDGGTTDGGTTDGGTTDGGTTGGGEEQASFINSDAPEADPDDDSSAFDVIANSNDHTTLLAAINAAGLADTLDDPDVTDGFTIFAPTNAAFAAFIEADAEIADSAALLADTDLLTTVLGFHVVAGTETFMDLSTGVTDAGDEPFTLAPLLENSELSFTNPAAGLTVSGSDGVGATVPTTGLVPGGEGAVGIVYSINAVLTPPEQTVAGTDTTGTTDGGTTDGGTTAGGGNAGPVQTVLEGGDFGTVSSILVDFLIKLDAETDDDPFTVLAISDVGLAGTTVVLDDIVANGEVGGEVVGGLTAEELQAIGTLTTRNNTMYVIGGTDGENDLTIGGVDATLIGGTASQTYRLDGVPASQ